MAAWQLTWIYKLTDPREGQHYCYVGMSTDPKRRLRHHKAYAKGNRRLSRWLKLLKRKGLEPEMTIMEQCYYRKDAREAEEDCISAIKAIRGRYCLNA